MDIPTVRIKADNEQGFIIINESDLREDQEIFTDPPKKEDKSNAQPKKSTEKK